MIRISLATEGKSEHWVIKHLVQTYFKGIEIFFRQVQPQIFDDTQESVGGWLEILKFCQRTEDIKSALIESDYLIIQIDTDQSQDLNFDVSHTKHGSVLKTNEELFEDIVAKIRGIIHADIETEYRQKIIFAVCIHTIECWLLPIFYFDNHKTATRNCLSTINKELKRRNEGLIPPKKNKQKRQSAFIGILSHWRRKQEIISSSQHNFGFKKFIESLQEIEKIAL